MSTIEGQAVHTLQGAPSFLLYQASRLWQKHFTAALRPAGLTPAQFGVLVHMGLLLRGKGPVSQIMLSRAIHNDVMTISQIVRALEKKGLVTRVPHPQDSRANSVSITPAGQKALTESLSIAARAREEFFAPISSKAGVLSRLLTQLIEFHQEEP
jgi:MarR family transcriptional regulator, organic hydroperoxide resistance regulator